jgi:hypothetical protein
MKSFQKTLKTLNFVSIRVHSWLQMTKVACTGCPIDMLILQNEPNFPQFSPKIEDFAKKRTQNEPKRTQCQSGQNRQRDLSFEIYQMRIFYSWTVYEKKAISAEAEEILAKRKIK